jgi:CRP-like cAMP-binding protein
MSQVVSFVITPLGEAELNNPQGELTTDQHQILRLVDGVRTIKDISALVSSSTSLYLNEFFEYLLLAGLISEAGSTIRQPSPALVRPKKPLTTTQKIAQERMLLTEGERRMYLENDLTLCQTELGSTTEKLDELSSKYKRIKHQVLSYKQGMEAKIMAQQTELDSLLQQHQQSLALRVALENELKQLRTDVEQLQEAVDQKSVPLEDAVKVRMLKERLIGEEQQREKLEVANEMLRTHPRYKKIRDLDFFKSFNNLELAELLVWAEWCEVTAGTVVLAEGEMGSPFYVVVSGKLVVQKTNKILTILKPGTPFGEGFYLEHENMCRSASVVARNDCELLRIDPAHLENAEPESRMRIAEAFMRIQTKRLRAASQMLRNLLAHS